VTGAGQVGAGVLAATALFKTASGTIMHGTAIWQSGGFRCATEGNHYTREKSSAPQRFHQAFERLLLRRPLICDVF
jgi:hypothetical protein